MATDDVSRLVLADNVSAEPGVLDCQRLATEGAEPAAIQGARALLERSPKVVLVVEFSADSIPANPGALAYLHDFVRQGFGIALIEPGGLTEALTPEACLAQLGNRLGYLYLSRGG